MKKILAGILACILTLAIACGAWAEEAEENAAAVESELITYDYEELKVAVTTPLTGNFFTSMWGNGSSDIDVRSMIHGYNLVEWNVEKGVFMPDESVVSGITAMREENGNVTFVIVLYDDLFYSDGSRITAWDYAFSFLLEMSPAVKLVGAVPMQKEFLIGSETYAAGRTNVLSGVRVTDDYTIAITLDHEYLPFFYETGLPRC